MWIESRMLWTWLFTIYWMQIVHQNQLLNVPQWKLTSDPLTFLVELISVACCKSVLSKIRGYRSMLMDILFTFPGNYCVGEGNTEQIYFYFIIITYCQLSFNAIAEKIRIKYALYVRKISWFIVVINECTSMKTNILKHIRIIIYAVYV